MLGNPAGGIARGPYRCPHTPMRTTRPVNAAWGRSMSPVGPRWWFTVSGLRAIMMMMVLVPATTSAQYFGCYGNPSGILLRDKDYFLTSAGDCDGIHQLPSPACFTFAAELYFLAFFTLLRARLRLRLWLSNANPCRPVLQTWAARRCPPAPPPDPRPTALLPAKSSPH